MYLIEMISLQLEQQKQVLQQGMLKDIEKAKIEVIVFVLL